MFVLSFIHPPFLEPNDDSVQSTGRVRVDLRHAPLGLFMTQSRCSFADFPFPLPPTFPFVDFSLLHRNLYRIGILAEERERERKKHALIKLLALGWN